MIHESILGTIGNTPVVKLHRLPPKHVDLYVKVEAFNPGAYPVNGGSNQRQRAQNLVASETHIFSPTVVNELRLGYTRMDNANLNQGLGTIGLTTRQRRRSTLSLAGT